MVCNPCWNKNYTRLHDGKQAHEKIFFAVKIQPSFFWLEKAGIWHWLLQIKVTHLSNLLFPDPGFFDWKKPGFDIGCIKLKSLIYQFDRVPIFFDKTRNMRFQQLYNKKLNRRNKWFRRFWLLLLFFQNLLMDFVVFLIV